MLKLFTRISKGPHSGQKLKLVQYFSITSLTIFTIAAVILGLDYRHQSISDLIHQEEQQSIALTRSFAHSIWKEFAPFLLESKALNDDELRRHSRIQDIQKSAITQMEGLRAVKIKIYDQQGRIIFSTQNDQIGQIPNSVGFKAALQGNPMTQLSHRETFQAFQGTIKDRNILSSYIPINHAGRVVGVFELYSDVTELIREIEAAQRMAVAKVLAIFGLVYLILLQFVRHAARLINTQNEALRKVSHDYKQQALHLETVNETLRRTSNAHQQQSLQLESLVVEYHTAQSHLIHQEKLAAIGHLVAGVAHEINTPLGAIQASAHNMSKALQEALEAIPLLSLKLVPEEQALLFQLIEQSRQSQRLLTSREKRPILKTIVKQLKNSNIQNARRVGSLIIDMGIVDQVELYIPLFQSKNVDWILQFAYNLTRLPQGNQTILTAVERASKVVFALKNYARHDQSGEPQMAKVQDGIETVLELYHNELKHGIDVEREYQPVPELLCYPDELIQVWTNLIHNSIQSMEGEGKLSIYVHQLENWCEVQITDSGQGIPKEVQSKIFEAFFTTKKAGEGSGLGLHISRQIIDKHEGEIDFESEPGKTQFTVRLPINEPSCTAPETTSIRTEELTHV